MLAEDVKELKKEKPEGVVTQEGACKYCGQMATVETIFGWLQEKVDEAVTQQCDCEAAREYASKEKAKERVHKKIDDIFLKQGNGVSIADKSAEYLHMAADKVAEYELDWVQIQTPTGIKAKISRTAKGKIKIEGSRGIKVTAEA